MSRFYSESSKVLGVLLVVLGAAMVVSTIARGGGPLTLGVVVGLLFVILGVVRLRLARMLGAPGR
jgi:hypothetical protein